MPRAGRDCPRWTPGPTGQTGVVSARSRPTSTSSTAWRVPLRRPDAADPERLAELLAAVAATVQAGDFGLGRTVASFEAELATALGAAHAVGVGSGTAAVRLALQALGVGRGDVVVVPAATHVGVAEAVVHLGAEVRPADVDEETGLLTAAALARVVDARVRAVVVVHLAGATADVDAIGEIARAVGARVVEDASHAPGAVVAGRRAGTLGDAGCLSLGPAAPLGAWGDAGAVLTDDPDVAERVRLLRAHGERPALLHRVVGDTAGLDGVQAAVLRCRLARLEADTAERRALAAALATGLGHGAAPAVTVPPAPAAGAPADHVHGWFTVQAEHRDELRRHLADSRIPTAMHWPVPLHLTRAFAGLGHGLGAFPAAERRAWRTLTLPLPQGMTDDERGAVVRAVRTFERPFRLRRAAGRVASTVR